MSLVLEDLVRIYRDRFGENPQWAARAPGRVNLIGEHLDYNGGLVLPIAIDRDIAMVAGASCTQNFRLVSRSYGNEFHWTAEDRPESGVHHTWSDYFLSVLDLLEDRGVQVPALKVVIDGDIPRGAGLSSSAAFEVCATLLCLKVQGLEWAKHEVALLAQAAEWGPRVGVKCGIMDQFISAVGQEGRAILLDCGSLDYESVPLADPTVSILIAHSTVERPLVGSPYNDRRQDCERGLALLNEASGQAREHLVNFSLEELARWGDSLPVRVGRRVRHVLSEQDRVKRFVECLRQGDSVEAGLLLQQSHLSLRDDFEVSCAELDALYDIALGLDGVYGCRMTGGGFGGCAVALIDSSRVEEVSALLEERFEREIGKRPWTLVTGAEKGAESFKLG